MATGTTTPGNYQSELPLQAIEDMLSTPQINLIHSIGAQEHEAQAHASDTARLSRLERLSTSGGRLDGSGIDPAPEIPVRTDVDAKMEIYAKSVVVSEQVDLFSSPGTQAKYKLLLGQWLYEKEDLLMRDLMAANVVFQDATGGLSSDNPTEITRNDINNIEKLLLNGNAKTVMASVQATEQIGTAPVRDAFIAMANTAISSDLQNVDGVQLKNNYPGVNPADFKPEEYCAVSRFRFFVSSEGIEEANASLLGNTVYKVPMAGVEAIGKIRQSGYTAKIGIIPNYAMSTVAQNYGMYAKFAIARAIQNQNWVSGLRVTVRL